MVRRKQRKLQCINPNTAGIDCGSEAYYAAIGPDRCDKPVRRFRAFTTDIYLWLTGWLSVILRPLRLSQPGCTGFYYTRSWRNAVSTLSWSMPSM